MDLLMFKMLGRSIKNSLGRYVAILAIVALGVGFYAGLKASQPAMLNTADGYLKEQKMYDFQLMSSLGLTEDDVESFKDLDGVEAAEGAYFAEAVLTFDGKDSAYIIRSLTDEVAIPVLTAGRMPESSGECLADDNKFSEKDIGRLLIVSNTNGEDTLDMLAVKSVKIVGLAKSPRYISNERGSTALASGRIEAFVLVPEETFDSEVFHEILLYCDLPGEIFSSEYSNARDGMEADVSKLLNKCGAARYKELYVSAMDKVNDAQAEINDGWTEYEDGCMTAEEELKKAWATLDNSEKELYAGEATLAEKERELEAGAEKIAAGRAELDAGEAEINSKRVELEAGKLQLAAGEAQVVLAETYAGTKRSSFESRKATGTAIYQQRVETYTARVASLQAEISALDPESFGYSLRYANLSTSLKLAQNELADAQSDLASALSRYTADETDVIEAENTAAAARAEFNAGKAQLEAGEAQLNAAMAQITAGREELDAAEAQLNDGREQLKDAKAELESGKAQIEDGKQKLRQSEADTEKELADAKAKLEDGEKELAEAREAIKDKLKLTVYTLTREENSGLVTFDNDTDIVTAVARAFPIFFVLIAALVCITTMTRMINDERTQIGTLKAMGWSSSRIMAKYLWYSVSAALIGCLLGFLLGVTVIPYVVWFAYNIIYNYNDLQFRFDIMMQLLSLAVSVTCIAVVTVFTCKKELNEVPAELIRPKAPAAGKRIILERVTPLWSRLSFLAKTTLRSAFRYPARVLMMLLGIGGCTALIIAGLGAEDSIVHVLDFQYGDVALYEMTVSYDSERDGADDEISAMLAGKTTDYALVSENEAKLTFEDTDRSVKLVSADEGDFAGIRSFRDGDGELRYPGNGEAIITKRMAEILRISIGDTVTVAIEDGETLSLNVTGICKNYLNHFVFVNRETAGYLANNTALVCTDAEDEGEALAASLRAEDAVTYVSLAKQEREMMESSMGSIDTVVLLIVGCAAALALITIYNLTNINIMERIREIATVKVLGFTPGETAKYILSENLLLCFLGAAVGLLLGKLLHRFVMELVTVEYLCFEIRIEPTSYLIAFVVTMVFAVIANNLMRPKLEKVNMAESLKSVE